MEGQLEAVEATVARLLRIGVFIAAAVIATGLLLFVVTGEPAMKRVIMAGLAILVCTPILRVLAALVVFTRERNRIYAGLCLAVLVLMVTGLVLGKVEH